VLMCCTIGACLRARPIGPACNGLVNTPMEWQRRCLHVFESTISRGARGARGAETRRAAWLEVHGSSP
jgi:hypothetical protein